MTDTSAGVALSLHLASEAATGALAAALASRAVAGDAIALRGDLGSGKTTFARAFIRSRGRGDEEVPSPTFTLVEVYEPARDGPPVWHFDLYRLTRAEEVRELGLDEALAGGIVLIEWPDRLGGLLPRERLDVTFLPGSTPERRVARLEGSRRWAARLQGLSR